MKYYGKAQGIAEKIVAAFETGVVAKSLAPIFIKRSGRHADRYSWTNQLLIGLAGWSDAMGYGSKDKTSGWLSVGRQVRKGEKATLILAPCTRVIDDPKAEGGKRVAVFGFRATPVFGIEQTDVVDAEVWAKHNKGNEKYDRFLETLPFADVAKVWGYKLGTYNAANASALGWHRRGESIAVGVENLIVWAHELMHAADYKNGKLVEHGQHWRSEVVAQLGACILMQVMGYETDEDLSFTYKYVQQYATTAGIEPTKACMDVLNRTCEAVNLILETADVATKLVSESDSEVAQTVAA